MEQLRYAQVNGVKLAYRVYGSGIPIVLIHGEGFSHELWTRQTSALETRHLVISYDRRGSGQSAAPLMGYSVLAHAEDVNQLLAHLGIGEAHFIVHSRGGAIIMQLLRLAPDKVRSIVFADAAIALANLSEAFKGAAARNQRVLTRAQAIARRENGKKSPSTRVAQADPEVREILHRMADQYSLRNFMNPQRSDFTSPMNIGPWNDRDFPDMGKLNKPVLLVVGELTDKYYIEGAEKAARLWPNARYQVIPGADHLLMLEAASTFNAMVLEFFGGVDAQISGTTLPRQ